MAETVRLWTDRFSYSGEIPSNYPGLRPRAIARINEETSTFGGYTDGVNSSREWYMQWDGSGAIWGRGDGPMGGRLQINGSGAATEQGRLQLDHFSGLWPSSDRRRILVGLWVWQNYEQSFNPLIDTRDTDPIVYLSTAGGTGDIRAQIYDAGGSLIFDQYESDHPWRQTTGRYFAGMYVDGYSGICQMFSVHEDGRSWLGPERGFTGTPNWDSAADVHLFSLRHAGYYESGFLDDAVIANPDDGFVLEDFVDDLANGTWANGYARPERDGDFTVTDSSIESSNSSNRSFSTGAERLSWQAQPSISIPSGTLLYSTDDGQTWQDANGGDALPETADGILLRRESMTLGTGVAYTGSDLTIPAIEVTPQEPWQSPESSNVAVPTVEGVIYDPTGTITVEPGDTVTVTAEPAAGYTFPSGATTSWTYEYLYPDPPSLEPILDVEIDQGELHTEQLTHQAAGPVWSVSSSDAISVSVDEGILSVAASFVIGSTTATVTLADEYGREVSQSFGVTVGPRAWDAGEPPIYPHAPTILWDDESPQQVLLDPLEAVVTKEINGAETFELTLPATHEHAGLIRNERVIEVAGDRYWVRRITTERNGRTVDLQVYAEARFYELSVAGQIDAQEFTQVSAGYVMELAVAGTGWSVDVANVSTLRSYSVERTNPLELLREVASNHGGDLIFDNTNRRVSLVTTSGRDAGVSFFHGRGITEAKRVVDTTSLVTRIYAVNEDGLTIADINGGRSYVEDYSYTDEVREATYDFKSGTSPFTMLSMVNATLANRSRPDRSYELTVQDLSVETGQQMDRFDVGDLVTVADPEIGIDGETQRIVKLEYDLLEPWNTEITLSATLRELSSSSDSGDAGTLETGAGASTFDLVPFNLLLNSRFDNGLAHWAHHGAQVVETQQGTSDYAVRFEGSGERWIEQTFTPDNRSAYAVSFEMDTDGPTDWVPDLVVEAEITYQDGETETITLDLT